MTTRRSRAKQAASASSASTGALFCVLLALQYGLQPFLKVFIAPEVNKVSLVLTTELTKIFIACALMAAEGSFARNFAGWNLRAASSPCSPRSSTPPRITSSSSGTSPWTPSPSTA